jgi:DNA-binding CsgD family transcriptional regulator
MNFRNVTVDVELLSAREREAWGHRMAGRSSVETAAAMGCNRQLVREFWHQAMKRTRKARTARFQQERGDAACFTKVAALDRKLSALGRCACGLLLPCVCLPSIYEVASNRRDAE